jgi:hypothetical protein
MPIYSGNIIFDTYKLRNTTTNNCEGYIIDLSVSGGTAPYKVSWSGVSSYSANTFILYDLCEGDYIGTITDKNGLIGTTTFSISATTKPTINVTLSDDSCVLDTNKKGVISVTTATTESERFRYELRKDGILTDTHYATTADTTHSFTSITNGSYSVTIVEEEPTIDDNEYIEGCTTLDYDSGDEYSGYTMSYLFSKWGAHIPFGPSEIAFQALWGPGAGETISFDSGLRKDGTIASDNPYVWLYTGATANRLTHSGTTWYLGTSGNTMTEGENVGPISTTANGDIGKFYYNTVINKFVIWWPSIGVGASSFRWVTIDPRVNYGQTGNPRATNATGTTYGFENVDVDGNDYTVGSDGKLALASSVLTGPLRKLKAPSGANNTHLTGRLSSCAYDNYIWETTIHSDGDDESACLLLHSFRDTVGTYGPIGVTHTLSLDMQTKTGHIKILNNRGNSAYAFNKYEIPTFRNCYSGCTGSTDVLTNGTTATTDEAGVITVLTNSGTTTPLPSGVNWNTTRGIRVKVTRNFNLFKIEFTDTLDGTIGDPKPYVSEYTIEFDLLDSTTWVGNAASAPEWTNNTSLKKYNSPGRIGIAHLSLPNTSFYHIKFKSDIEGHSTTELISATDKTTNNLITSKKCGISRTSTTGIPSIRPRVSATIQVMPEPKTFLDGVNKPKTMVKETIGYKSAVNIFHATADTKVIKFTFGGKNSDITLENAYPKYRIYPYIFETEEVSTLPDYEAIFGSLTNEVDEGSRSSIINEDITIPIKQLSTETSWEFIIRPSFLYKDKTSDNDVWIDTAKYPPSKDIDYNNDYYMAVLTNPETPELKLDDFELPNVGIPSLKTERVQVEDMPHVTATTYTTAVYKYQLKDAQDNRGRTAPLVVVNGISLASGVAGNSDYKYTQSSRTIEFHPETVQNGDWVQVTYDALGGTYSQFLTVPDTVSDDDTNEIFQKDDYYYINLEMQSLGAVGVAVNGLTIYNGVDFQKTGEKQIMLMKGSDTYLSGDTISLFYRTIYTVVSFTTTKEPEIPVIHKKRNRFVEDITVNLFDVNGNLVQEQKESIGCDEIGDVVRNYTLKPPTFGDFSYNVVVKRYYPLIDGEVVTSESHSDRVAFEISRDVFYSPLPA